MLSSPGMSNFFCIVASQDRHGEHGRAARGGLDNIKEIQGQRLALQVIWNIAVVTNTIPNTGITLPFISYGGTSAVFLLGEMGLAMNVGKCDRIN